MNLNDLDESLRSEKPHSAMQVVEEGRNDYFKRRKDEEDRIAGVKAPAKRTPKQTDYEKKRKQQGVAEGNPIDTDWYRKQQERQTKAKQRQQGVAEAGYSGVDDTDTVGFSVNSERAYNAVMARFGDHIDHDETSGTMYVPARMWPNVEVVAFDADGEGATREDSLEEVDRRGFLKRAGVLGAEIATGLGSAYLGGEVIKKYKDTGQPDPTNVNKPIAKPNPKPEVTPPQSIEKRELPAGKEQPAQKPMKLSKWRHEEASDPLTGKRNGKYSTLRSDNSNAVLHLNWPGNTRNYGSFESDSSGFVITIPNEIVQLGVRGSSGRIKINGKIHDISLYPMADHGDYSSAGVLDQKIAREFLLSNGEVSIELPIYGKGNQIFKFTAEQDDYIKNEIKKFSRIKKSDSDELAESDNFHAVLAFADGRQQSLRLANPVNPVKQVLSYMIRRRDIDALKRLVSVDGVNVKNIISQLMAGRSNQVNLESRMTQISNTINRMLEAAEKIGGRHTPSDFDSMVGRVGQQAKQGPMKTVWDPVKRVYKNVPVNKK